MSTKIYNGYILNKSMDLFELHQWVNSVRKKVEDKALELFSIQVKDILKNSKVKLTESKASRLIQDTHIDIYKSDLRDPLFDYGFNFAILPLIRDSTIKEILLLLYAEKQELIDLWSSLPEIEDYHYQNQVDRPDELTEDQWDQRKLDWDKVLGTRGIPSKVCFSVDIIGKNDIVDLRYQFHENLRNQKKIKSS